MREHLFRELEDLEFLSAIWILASQDEVPLITYEGIKRQLGLPKNYDIKSLIAQRRELFRTVSNPAALDQWRSEMLGGKRVPSWIAENSEEGDREKAINKLSVNDVFRSQFRSPKNAAPSQIEIISWGLDHLDRLRKGFIEARGERWRFFREIVVPIATVLVAIAALTSSALVQMTSMRSQAELKKFEVLTRPKQDA